MTEPVGTPTARYEVEHLTATLPGGEAWDWRPVVVFRADAIPTPLTFDDLDQARAYVGRAEPGEMRIVRVDEEGEREVVG